MFGPLQVRALSKKLWKLKSENLKRLILLSDSARWPATPTHPCTTLTQRGLSSQIFESRLNCILTKCMFGPPKLVSENRVSGPKSKQRCSEEENLQSSSLREDSYEESNSLSEYGEPAILSHWVQAYNHFNFGAPQFPGTACMQPSFLCPPWYDVSLYSYHCRT